MNEQIKELCRLASVEEDSAKLAQLVQAILEALEEERSKKNGNAALRVASQHPGARDC